MDSVILSRSTSLLKTCVAGFKITVLIPHSVYLIFIFTFGLAELFSECYHDSEERAFDLLVRKNRYWSKMTCLHLATEADAKSFFAHDGVQVSILQGVPFLKVLDNPQLRRKWREHCYVCTQIGLTCAYGSCRGPGISQPPLPLPGFFK